MSIALSGLANHFNDDRNVFDLISLCGPLANSRFHHRPNPAQRPNSKLEAAYHKADNAIQSIVDLLAAA